MDYRNMGIINDSIAYRLLSRAQLDNIPSTGFLDFDKSIAS